MTRYIAFLRAINVGGHTVTMEVLRALFQSLGCSRVEAFIASGNVIFDSAARDTGKLEKYLAAGLQKALGYEVVVFIRTPAEVAAIARHQGFPAEALETAQALNIALLAAPLSPAALLALEALKTDIDDFHAHGREVHWLCRKKQNESKFSNAIFERRLHVRATFRGLSTLVKLSAKYPPEK